MRIIVWKSSNGWRWRITASNGQKLATSESYASRRNCRKTARAVAKVTGLRIEEGASR